MSTKRKRKPGKRITAKAVQATENDPPPQNPADVELTFKPEDDNAPWDGEGLTPRQLLFVQAFVGPAGANQTKAAELAGYRADNYNALKATASRLLTFVNVKAAIARRLAVGNFTAEWVHQMSAALAASNMGTFMALGEDGQPFIDWKQAHDLGAFVQIRKYKEKGLKYPGADGQAKIDVIERTIETHNPAPHIDRIARMLGLVKDQPAASVTVNVNQVSEDDLVRIATRGGNGIAAPQAGPAQPDRLRERD